ncbi:hypothetical protein GCM10029963_32570 [Micromonospora andamanensis]|nr:hypothetical protein Vwe01_61410 [Micromonospora andamanensis]
MRAGEDKQLCGGALQVASERRAMRGLVRGLAVATMAVVAMVTATAPAYAANLGQRLYKGTYMHKGDYIARSGVQLLMQQDGNLVLRNTYGVCWASGTNPSGHQAVYQRDGNFVVLNSSGRALWASNTVGDPGTTVSIETNGNLYVGNKLISVC